MTRLNVPSSNISQAPILLSHKTTFLPGKACRLYSETCIKHVVYIHVDGTVGRTMTAITRRYRVFRCIEHLKCWINNHLDDRHSLSSLAEQAEMSITRMQRLFKTNKWLQCLAYIRFERLLRAQKQLEVTAMNIKSISVGAGYSSVPAFTAAFHSTFGDTPGRFRERNQISYVTKERLDYRNHQCTVY